MSTVFSDRFARSSGRWQSPFAGPSSSPFVGASAPLDPYEVARRQAMMRAAIAAYQAQLAPKTTSSKGLWGSIGGALGGIAAFGGRFAEDIANTAYHAPMGLFQLGWGAGQDVLDTITFERARNPGQGTRTGSALAAMVRQVPQDFRDWKEHPGNLALDIWTIASLGAGGAARMGAKTGEIAARSSGRQAAAFGGASKALNTVPNLLRPVVAPTVALGLTDNGLLSAGYQVTKPVTFAARDKASIFTERLRTRTRELVERPSPALETAGARYVAPGEQGFMAPDVLAEHAARDARLFEERAAIEKAATEARKTAEREAKRAAAVSADPYMYLDRSKGQFSFFGSREGTRAIAGRLPPAVRPQTYERSLYQESGKELPAWNKVLKTEYGKIPLTEAEKAAKFFRQVPIRPGSPKRKTHLEEPGTTQQHFPETIEFPPVEIAPKFQQEAAVQGGYARRYKTTSAPDEHVARRLADVEKQIANRRRDVENIRKRGQERNVGTKTRTEGWETPPSGPIFETRNGRVVYYHKKTGKPLLRNGIPVRSRTGEPKIVGWEKPGVPKQKTDLPSEGLTAKEITRLVRLEGATHLRGGLHSPEVQAILDRVPKSHRGEIQILEDQRRMLKRRLGRRPGVATEPRTDIPKGLTNKQWAAMNEAAQRAAVERVKSARTARREAYEPERTSLEDLLARERNPPTPSSAAGLRLGPVKQQVDQAIRELRNPARQAGVYHGQRADEFAGKRIDLSKFDLRITAGKQTLAQMEERLAKLEANPKAKPKIVERYRAQVERYRTALANAESLRSVLPPTTHAPRPETPSTPQVKSKRKGKDKVELDTARGGTLHAESKPETAPVVETTLEERAARPAAEPKPVVVPDTSGVISTVIEEKTPRGTFKPAAAPEGTPRIEYIAEWTKGGKTITQKIRATNDEWAAYLARNEATRHGFDEGSIKVRPKDEKVAAKVATQVDLDAMRMSYADQVDKFYAKHPDPTPEQIAAHEKATGPLWDKIKQAERELDEARGDLRPAERPDPTPESIPAEVKAAVAPPAKKAPAGEAPKAPFRTRRRVVTSKHDMYGVVDAKGKIEVLDSKGKPVRGAKGSKEAAQWGEVQRATRAKITHEQRSALSQTLRERLEKGDTTLKPGEIHQVLQEFPDAAPLLEAFPREKALQAQRPKGPREMGVDQRALRAIEGVTPDLARSYSVTLEKRISQALDESDAAVLSPTKLKQVLDEALPAKVSKAVAAQMKERGFWQKLTDPSLGIALLPKRPTGPIAEGWLAGGRKPVVMPVQANRLAYNKKTGLREIDVAKAVVEISNNPLNAFMQRLSYGMLYRMAKVTKDASGVPVKQNLANQLLVHRVLWESGERARLAKYAQDAGIPVTFADFVKAAGVTTADLRRDRRAFLLRQDRSKIMPTGKPWEGTPEPQGTLFGAVEERAGHPPLSVKETRIEAQRRYLANQDRLRAERLAQEGKVGENWAWKAIDSMNQFAQIGILYLKPAYLAPNLIGQMMIVSADHNMNPLRMTQNFAIEQQLFGDGRIAKGLDKALDREFGLLSDAERRLADRLMGEGVISSVRPGEGLGVLSAVRRTHGRMSTAYGRLLDVPWRRISFVNEARRWGYNDAAAIHDLLVNPNLADVRLSVVRRANRNIIDFGRMTKVEKAYFRRLIFFYPWIKGATLWSARWVSEHPAQALLTAQYAHQNENRWSETLGLLPSYAQGLIPTGSRVDKQLGKIPLVYNPQSLSVLSTPAQVIAAVKGLVTGNPKQADRVAEMLTPALSALLGQATGQDPFTGRQLRPSEKGLVPFVKQAVGGGGAIQTLFQHLNLAEKIASGEVDSRNVLYPYTPGEAISRYLGPGLAYFTPEVMAVVSRVTGYNPKGPVVRDWTASVGINPKQARSRALAETRAAADRVTATQLKYREYLDLTTEQAREKGVVVPKELPEALSQRAMRDIGEVNMAESLNKSTRDLTQYERLASDLAVLIKGGQMKQAEAQELMVALGAADDKIIERFRTRLGAAYFGTTYLGRLKKYFEVQGVEGSWPS